MHLYVSTLEIDLVIFVVVALVSLVWFVLKLCRFELPWLRDLHLESEGPLKLPIMSYVKGRSGTGSKNL